MPLSPLRGSNPEWGTFRPALRTSEKRILSVEFYYNPTHLLFCTVPVALAKAGQRPKGARPKHGYTMASQGPQSPESIAALLAETAFEASSIQPLEAYLDQQIETEAYDFAANKALLKL